MNQSEYTQISVKRPTHASLREVSKVIRAELGVSSLSLSDTIDKLVKFYAQKSKNPNKLNK